MNRPDRVESVQVARATIVAGNPSMRTRDVLHALADVPNVMWPRSRDDLLRALEGAAAGCLVLADDLGAESADEILLYVREHHPFLPVFVITDSGDLAEAVAAMRKGATAAIEIPPSYALLREHVAAATR